MKKMLKPQKTHKTLGEQGFASIVIALIMIIVLALLTVGFAQLARREQRSSLDKQLATQAYYAAESGVNDITQQLPTLQANMGSLPAAKTNGTKCYNDNPVTLGPAENGVQYTCVLVNLKPPAIRYSNVGAETMRYIVSSATTTAGAPATSLTVNWGSDDGQATFARNLSDKFLTSTSWNNKNRPAVLEFSLTPLNDLSRAGLMNNTFTVFLYPVRNGRPATVSYSAGGGAANGQIIAANCNTSNGGFPCKATITGLTGGTGKYLFRVISHYDASNILINGSNAGTPTGFDGQVSIDVTGKAHEVLKRIQVWKPLKTSYSNNIPSDALESMGACKRFTTDPVGGTVPQSVGEDSTGACQLN